MALNELVSYDFTGADLSGLGAGWSGGFTGYANFTILSNQGTSPQNQAAWQTNLGATFPNDQYGEIEITKWDTENQVGILLRCADSPTATAYFLGTSFFGTTATDFIYKYTNGSSVSLIDQTSSITWAVGDKVRGTVQGNVLTLYHVRGTTVTQVLTVTDNTSPLTSGRVGISMIFFTGGTAGDVWVDNFKAGSITSSAAALDGAATLSLSASGQLDTGIQLAASSSLSLSTSGQLTTAIPLLASAILSLDAVASLTGGVSSSGWTMTPAAGPYGSPGSNGGAGVLTAAAGPI